MQRSDTTTELEHAPADVEQSKARRIGFRVVVAVFALWVLALNGFALLEPFFMWLPGETAAEMLGEETWYITLHRTHFVAIGLVAWAVVLSTLVQLRKPERRVAPMFLLIAVAAGATILYGLSGTMSEWLIEEIAMVVLPLSLVALLHPSRDRIFSVPAFDQPLAGLAALAALPWLVYIADNAWTQFVNVSGDPHAEMEHWATAALLGVAIVVGAFLGSSDHDGWRLTGWIAAGASVIFGVHSLVFPGLASGLPMLWAVTAIFWGVAFGAMMVKRQRSGVSTGVNARKPVVS